MPFIQPGSITGDIAKAQQNLQTAFKDYRTVASALKNTTAGTAQFWGDAPDQWDTIVLGGFTMPGMARLKGAVEQLRDRKKTPGKNGQKSTFLGYLPAVFKIEIIIWTAAHFDQLQAILPGLMTPKTTTVPVKKLFSGVPNAPNQVTGDGFGGLQAPVQGVKPDLVQTGTQTVKLPIVVSAFYPSLALVGIKNIELVKFSLLEPMPNPLGFYRMEIDAEEWKSTPASVGRTSGATAAIVRPTVQKDQIAAQNIVRSRPSDSVTPPPT